ncbi:MAG: hypothetical protein FJ363_06330 [Gemmatimonadetes bacterium]|nr:hypothetical protein [Gemmatimonadota bacterium]
MRARWWGLALLAPLGLAAQAPARQRTCNLELYNFDSTTTLLIKLPSGQYNGYYGRGVRGKCTNTDQRLAGDSLETMGEQKSYTIIGRAHYEEKRVRLDADRINYYQLDERVLAEGNVVAVTENGTVMRGPRAEYYREMPGMRAQSRLVATGRPVTRLSPADAGGGATDTVEVIADQVVDVADSLLYAGGSVVINRPDLSATSDSATMDSGTEWARLNGRPRIEGRGESKFTLVGRQVDLWSRDRKLTRVLSADSARATSEDVTLASDSIDLRLTEQKLSRAYAWGVSRARAVATDRDILADSIDVDMPGQVLRELRALRSAFAKSKTDTTKFTSTEDDWLRGDTIVAAFDSARAAGDSAAKPQVRTILASGAASSFYQVASSQGARAAPNLNYVKGQAITVQFGADRAVQSVSVREQAAGVYLERLAVDSLSADSTAAAKPPAANATQGQRPTAPQAPASPGARTPPPTPAKKP